MEVKNQTKMKKGITLIEIILAIVLIAIILGITIPKLMANSAKAEIKQVITSDIRSIVEAATTWRRASSTAAGNYKVLSSAELFSRLPQTMQVENAIGTIFSSGLRTGEVTAGGSNETGAQYTVVWQFDTTITDTGTFSIGMDITNGTGDLNWSANLQQYALEVFRDTINEIASEAATRFSTTTFTSNGTLVSASVTDRTVVYNCADANISCLGDIQTN